MQKSLRGKISLISVRRLFVLTVMAVVLATASVVASAEQNTFTKWVTTAPSMAGVVGGDDGAGSYTERSSNTPKAPPR